MAEYIDRKALGIGKCNPDIFEDKGYANGWNSAIKIIEEAPAVDVKPVKHGKWISMLVKRPDWKGNMQFYYQPNTCSECHIGLAEKTNYCPNCGAKMDGKEVQE